MHKPLTTLQCGPSPAGFTQNFASLTGAWGVGTYYATKPRLALQFGYTLQAGDLAFSTNLAGLSHSQRQGLKQVLAVDVLTGKSKHLGQNRSLRMPPKLEDAQVGQYVLFAFVLDCCYNCGCLHATTDVEASHERA